MVVETVESMVVMRAEKRVALMVEMMVEMMVV